MTTQVAKATCFRNVERINAQISAAAVSTQVKIIDFYFSKFNGYVESTHKVRKMSEFDEFSMKHYGSISRICEAINEGIWDSEDAYFTIDPEDGEIISFSNFSDFMYSTQIPYNVLENYPEYEKKFPDVFTPELGDVLTDATPPSGFDLSVFINTNANDDLNKASLIAVQIASDWLSNKPQNSAIRKENIAAFKAWAKNDQFIRAFYRGVAMQHHFEDDLDWGE